MLFHRNENGQSTLEFLTSASLLMITVTGVGWLFKAEWERGKCAYLVFEKTHAAVTGAPSLDFSLDKDTFIQIQDQPDGKKGIAFCKGTPETVSIPKLEPDAAPAGNAL
jgi:hypothetical protein